MGTCYLIWQIPNYHFTPNVCVVHLLISINCFLESVSLWTKMIPLSGAFCNINHNLIKLVSLSNESDINYQVRCLSWAIVNLGILVITWLWIVKIICRSMWMNATWKQIKAFSFWFKLQHEIFRFFLILTVN
jgi:hypothetical protein